ncbi:YdaU family protein [Akkermansiaceae bacterium]|nr:YdaU family protein [Akkermansiaceae bacterium]
MNFYPHHIGDFNNATRHLTRVERSVYRDATDLYYDTEKPLMLDLPALQKRLICLSDEEKEALGDVLAEFFTKTDEGYFHSRCDAEIEKYHSNVSAKAKAGRASAEARKAKKSSKSTKSNTCSTPVQQSVNEIQLTKNQEPLTKNHEPKKISPSGSCPLPANEKQQAELIYDAYPRKTAKPAALKAITKALKTMPFDEMLKNVEAFAKSRDGEDVNFTPHPATWFNRGSYTDDPESYSVKSIKSNSRTEGTHNEGQTFGAGANPNQVEFIEGLE